MFTEKQINGACMSLSIESNGSKEQKRCKLVNALLADLMHEDCKMSFSDTWSAKSSELHEYLVSPKGDTNKSFFYLNGSPLMTLDNMSQYWCADLCYRGISIFEATVNDGTLRDFVENSVSDVKLHEDKYMGFIKTHDCFVSGYDAEVGGNKGGVFILFNIAEDGTLQPTDSIITTVPLFQNDDLSNDSGLRLLEQRYGIELISIKVEK